MLTLFITGVYGQDSHNQLSSAEQYEINASIYHIENLSL